MTAARPTFDLARAVEVNAVKLQLAALPLRTQQLIAIMLSLIQAEAGLPADGMYGPLTERLRNDLLRAHGAALPGVAVVDTDHAPKIALPGALTLTVDQVMERWRVMSLIKIVYALGSGGTDPRSSDPRTHGKRGFGLDCSGAACYALGLPRRLETFPLYGGWMNTDAIVADAEGAQTLYEPCPVQRGCLLVFPSVDYDEDGDRDRIGHVAGVDEVLPGFDHGAGVPDYRQVMIFDCAGSNSAKVKGAVGDVARHDAGYFNNKHIHRQRTSAKWRTRAVWCKSIPRPAA